MHNYTHKKMTHPKQTPTQVTLAFPGEEGAHGEKRQQQSDEGRGWGVLYLVVGAPRKNGGNPLALSGLKNEEKKGPSGGGRGEAGGWRNLEHVVHASFPRQASQQVLTLSLV